MAALRPGQGATVRLNAMPDQSFAGRVERVGDVVDPATRTVKAYIRVSNGARALRPGMFATVALDAPAAAGAAAPMAVLTVPEAAVVTDGDTRYVFVEVAPRSYERRAVEVAPGSAAGRVVVTSGVAAGEPVVVRGAFTLKSELGKAGFGEDD
jgi:cobalt-zinc-cadmium efflux system membrane fusion protein